MTINNTTAENGNKPSMSPLEIEKTFKDMGLNDTKVRQFYAELDEQVPINTKHYWTRIHTSSDIPK